MSIRRTGLVAAIALAAVMGGVSAAYAQAPAIPAAVPGDSVTTAKNLEATILSVVNDPAALNALLTELATSPPAGYSQQEIYAAIAAASLATPSGTTGSATLAAATSSYLSVVTSAGTAAVSGATALASEIEGSSGGGGGGGSNYQGA